MTFEQLADLALPLPSRVLLGLSGGADSVALCRILMCLRERGHVAFSAVHVHHGLRGKDADGDEAFVRALCGANDIPLTVERLTPPDNPSENWAREARYAVFARTLEADGAQAACLAHHMDDQAETVLLHLMRGAGHTGLCGMRRESVTLGVPVVRPLLGVDRAALREALLAAGQPWREDGSNASPRYLRNRVRQELLPLMESLAPGACSRMARSAFLLQPEEALMARMAQEALRGADSDFLPMGVLSAAPEELHPRMLRLWLGLEEAHHVQRALQLLTADAGAACPLPGGRRCSRGWRGLHVTRENAAAYPETPLFPETPVAGEGSYPCGGVTLRILPGGRDPGDGRRAQELPQEALAGCVLRTRRQGDFIRPFGMDGKQSLQDYFTNRRVDAPFRDAVPLLCRGSEVLLAAGVGAGSVPRWNGQGTLLRLQWEGNMRWSDA